MKGMNYYNSFWYRFTRSIKRWWFRQLLKRNELIKIDDRHRGIGKTYMIVDRALKEDIPIIVGSQIHIDVIKRYANVVEVYGLADNFRSILGKRFPNGVLIDESVKPELISEIKARDIRIRGGFINKNWERKWFEIKKDTSSV